MLNHFNFKLATDNKVLVTNDFGEYAFLSLNSFRRLVKNSIDVGSEDYALLRQRKFILVEGDLIAPEVIDSLRNIKQYAFAATSLHIFVVCGSCNLQCQYCQARSHGIAKAKFMDVETARRAVDIALQSPSKSLSFEFQGGEPLLNFPVIQEIVEYSEQRSAGKRINYSVVSNLSLITDSMIDFFLEHNVSISTSLDGPQDLHDENRPHPAALSSYTMLMNSMDKLTANGLKIGAIQTTTRQSLACPREVVRAYEGAGLKSIFLRPLTPLGFAAQKWEEIGYTPEQYVDFYKAAFEEILAVNRRGHYLSEQQAAIFLKKILLRQGINYMDLRSPCGAGIGQIAYHYDGKVYTCDEGRMLAEAGDPAFLLGDVYTDTYQDIVGCENCAATCVASVIEALPGCCDCAYQPYCGVCPVINYACDGSVFRKDAHDYKCKIHTGILDYLFSLIYGCDASVMHTLETWVKD